MDGVGLTGGGELRFALLLLVLLLTPPLNAQQNEWSPVEQALGRAGTLSGGVYKVSFPRTDLQVSIGKTRLEPAAALGTWMAFRRSGADVVADGDLVVTAAELAPLTSALTESGIEISAIHNHLAGERPSVYYVHFFYRGRLEQVLAGLKRALSVTATPMLTAPADHPAVLPYDREPIEKTLGVKGSPKGVVLLFSFPREHAIHMREAELPPAMGMATAINFQPSPAGVAATGDFVLQESEAGTVVKKLREQGVLLTALHNHLMEDEPRTVFLHFWVEGPGQEVAAKLKRALDELR